MANKYEKASSEMFAQYWQTRDLALRNRIVVSNLGLAGAVAKRFAELNIPQLTMDDYFSATSMALIKDSVPPTLFL